ncbi:MAG TPA: nucleoside triphosphate pyrophosphohydrolase family protein [Streptosporangiaceae bacterium]|jgi:predicted HAD superfamily Cof-like phosphohydrolase|nr:nucleoside triphosphate pyrophosphohydrolase family protein [Streptosporangiaceae bacterium]
MSHSKSYQIAQDRLRRADATEPSQQSGPLAALLAFHRAFDLPRQALPNVEIAESLAKLRIALLEEEVGEFIDAVSNADLIGIADALADIVCVVYGTAITYGIDLDRVMREVHRSNMSKLDAKGRPLIRDDGKVIKSDQYFPPDVAGVLKLQPPMPV